MIYEIAGTAPFRQYHESRKVHPENRPFVAWDGEGITADGERQQDFVLFGCNLDTPDEWLQVGKGQRLTTHQCLSHILDVEKANPDAIHAGFSFSYDVEMILRDVPLKTLRILRTKGYCFWSHFRIEYKAHKWFQVGRTFPDGTKLSARIWDVWGFFQCSFIKAVEDNLGEIPELPALREGKASRELFTHDDMESFIIPYWQTELRLTKDMMTTLRERLYAAELRINQWHGPGAIASYQFRKIKLEQHMGECPAAINDAAQYAYAGGRFELFQAGNHSEPVWAYDIRSAYPSGIAQLPSLADNLDRWQWVDNPDRTKLARFGVYHIRFHSRAVMTGKPMPFFYRDTKSAIHFPNVLEGWYWSPEVELAEYLGDDVEILGGWEYAEDGSRPFEWVTDTYNTRAEWKRAGNASQMALKLLLNSCYGKMAQRVGWQRTGNAPKWHQLEWAGWVTSNARAQLFRAMLQSYGKGALLGVETDGIFSSQPLTLDEGPGLGQWECTQYDAMTYLQSGFYFLKSESKWIPKNRGFDKGSVTVNDVHKALTDWKPWDGSPGIIAGETTRFSTMGTYVNHQFGENLRNVWQTSDRILVIGGDGKRTHRPRFCPQCIDKVSPMDSPHRLTINQPIGGMSRKHILPWLSSDNNPFREGEYEGKADLNDI